MAIDLDKEQILSLTEATRAIPARNGRKPGVATLWRWCRKGVKGVQLDYVRMGRGIATSREALSRFFHALAEADRQVQEAPASIAVPPKSEPRQSALRRASLAQADEIIARDGLMTTSSAR